MDQGQRRLTAKVYVMDDGRYRKIGFSRHPERRAKQVGPLARVVFQIEVDNHVAVERAAHVRLGDKRVAGEWFDVVAEEAIEAIRYAIQNPYDPADGGRFPTMTLSPAEAALWNNLVAEHGGGGRGAAKRTLVKAMRALAARKRPSADEIIAWVTERLATAPEPKKIDPKSRA